MAIATFGCGKCNVGYSFPLKNGVECRADTLRPGEECLANALIGLITRDESPANGQKARAMIDAL